MFRRVSLSIIRNLAVYTQAKGIGHTGFADFLLARSEWSSDQDGNPS